MRLPCILLLVIILGLVVSACRPERERLVDEMAANLEETATILATQPPGPQRSQAALDHLESSAVRMRILQSRLDGTVRTLNDRQRADLVEYTRQRLEPLRDLLRQATP